MMRRPSLCRGIVIGLALLLAMSSGFGCQSVLVTAMYLIKGTDVDPEFPGLKGKKVAVVCRSDTLQSRNANASRELAVQMTNLLKDKVPKIQIVDQRKITKWTDENTWEEFTEVGKAVKADIVVGVDLESFDIYQGQTLYQGKANASIRVYDCKDGNKMVFEKHIPQSLYPPNSAVPTSERREDQFRREYILVLADQIARHFYAHDAYADYNLDTNAMH
jgi:hypothetical protein